MLKFDRLFERRNELATCTYTHSKLVNNYDVFLVKGEVNRIIGIRQNIGPIQDEKKNTTQK